MSVTVFDLDDLCDEWDPWDELHALKERFPDLKVTLFAIPYRCSDDLLARYRDLDWVELGVHGYHHSTMECATWGYDEAVARLTEIEEWWPGTKLFKAPGWVGNPELYRALLDRGWKAATHIGHRSDWGAVQLPMYVYNATQHNALHGHTWDCMGNGPSDWGEMFGRVEGGAEFAFVSDVCEFPETAWESLAIPGHQSAAANVVRDWMEICGVETLDRPSTRRKVWPWYGFINDSPGSVCEGDILVSHHFGPEGAEGRIVTSWAIERGVKIVVPCEETRRVVEEELGGDVLAVIPYWLPEAEVLPKASKFRVGIMGDGTAKYKNFDYVRDVCESLGIEVVDWATEAIKWDRDKEDFFRQSAVVVNVSDVEGGPLPPLEALQRGRFAISTRVGMMSQFEDVPQLQLIEKGELREAILEARRQWAKTAPDNWLPGWVTDRARVQAQWGEIL